MTCPSCGAPDQPGQFCNRCGTRLPVPPERLEALRAFIPGEVAERILAAGGAGERRIVTAMICDVTGSTPLGERLGPERFKVVMDQVLGRVIAAVSRYEGTVAQVMGDGLLAFFGAPIAHEDDPERAVRAAVDACDAIVAYAGEIDAAYGLPLAIRVGLNTGPVVLSHVTDVLQVAYNALGDTVTTAARLEGAAAPGTVLAAETTAHLVAAICDLRPAGPLTLKGKTGPVAAFEIVAVRAGAARVLVHAVGPGTDSAIRSLGAWVKISQPSAVTTTSSSIRTPPHPGR